jgi:hypothetical protein
MLTSKTSRGRWLFILFIVSMAVSLAHYTDNVIHIKDYTDPLTATDIEIFGAIMILFGALGWIRYLRGDLTRSFYLFYVYSLINIAVLLHYIYMPFAEMTLKMNTLIFGEAITGAIFAAYVAWLHWHEHST